MQRLTLYGDSRSGNCYKAAWIMRLLRQPFDWVEIDAVQRQTRTPQFLKLNPNGKVPLLAFPDGRRLAESNAILLYLARGSPYFPEDRWQQAQVSQWLFWEQYSHEPYIAVARFVVRFLGREAEEAERLKMLRERGSQALALMNSALSDTPFLVGGRFGIADIALFAYTHKAEDAGIPLQPFPEVTAWIARIESLPGFQSMLQACRSFP